MTLQNADLVLEGFQNSPGTKVVRPHFRVGLTFYPQTNDPVLSRDTEIVVCNWDKNETQGTVVSFQWSKQMGAASGQWGAVIKFNKQSSVNIVNALNNELNVNIAKGDILGGDWVRGSVLRNGIVWPIFQGVVDSVREKITTSGGEKIREVLITGRDHGALFESIIAWNNIYVKELPKAVSGMFTAAFDYNRISGTPDTMFQAIIHAMFGQKETTPTQSAWTLPFGLQQEIDAERFIDALNIVLPEKSLRGSYMNQPLLWTQPGQTTHQALSQWCNPMLNEFFYDLVSMENRSVTLDFPISSLFQMQATIRENPFVNTIDEKKSPWYSLREWTIPSWLIYTSNLGRSNVARITVFDITASSAFITPTDQQGVVKPLWSPTGIQYHGIKPYISNTKYIVGKNKDSGPWIKERDEWQRLICDWIAPEPYYLNGTMEFGTMFPEIRIGDRLRINTGDKNAPILAYIEGVNHTFSFTNSGPIARTSLMVSKGFKGTDTELLNMVKKASNSFKQEKQ